jgi:hypothetical protein
MSAGPERGVKQCPQGWVALKQHNSNGVAKKKLVAPSEDVLMVLKTLVGHMPTGLESGVK